MVIKTVSLLCMSIFTLLVLIAPNLIDLIYGEKWLPAVPIIRALLPFFIFSVIQHFMVHLKLIEGQSKSVLYYQLIAFAVLLVVIYPLIHWQGVVGAAIAVDLSAGTSFIFLLMETRKVVKISWVSSIFKPLLMVVLTSIGVIFISQFIDIILWSNLLQVSLITFLFASIFITLLVFFEKEFIRSVWEELLIKET